MRIKGDASIEALHAVRSNQPERGRMGATEMAGLVAHVKGRGRGGVQFSQRAQEVQQVRDLARAEPDFRAEVVDRARADLQAGRLSADPHELAVAVARDLF